MLHKLIPRKYHSWHFEEEKEFSPKKSFYLHYYKIPDTFFFQEEKKDKEDKKDGDLAKDSDGKEVAVVDKPKEDDPSAVVSTAAAAALASAAVKAKVRSIS